jgi:3-hydroxyacyl-[acyl-carrier-protein] dehydratase
VRTAEGTSATIRLRYEHRDTGEPGLDPVPAGLPHRYPLLLVDRILHHSASERLIASKAVTRGEPWFRPDEGMPGRSAAYPRVLVLESWCQAASLLAIGVATGSESPPPQVLFGGMADVGWRGDAYPGDVIIHEVVHTRTTGRIFSFRGQSSIGHRVVLSVGEVTLVLNRAPDV